MYSKIQKECLAHFANLSDLLFEKGIIETDSFTGEIGEYYACKLLHLTKTQRVTRAVDGIDSHGNKYQVKSKIVTNGFTYNLKKLESDLFDFLVIVFFDDNYTPLRILKIPSSTIKNNAISINNVNSKSFDEIPIIITNIPPDIRNLIGAFASAYTNLIVQGIIRSRRIVGDIGEFYACNALGLNMSKNKNEKGIDAQHPNGLTFEIKTRRVYSSKRRVNEFRRLNNLEGKISDYLIVVTLNHSFKCSGMWIMPTKNITNPKQAKLQIVNTTPGTYSVVKTNIPWLINQEPFEGFSNSSVLKKSNHKTKKHYDYDSPISVPIKKIRQKKRKIIQDENKSFTLKENILLLMILLLFVFGIVYLKMNNFI
jgi:hypothetical protein